MQQVEKCLNSFDNVHEWADCIAFLKQLLKVRLSVQANKNELNRGPCFCSADISIVYAIQGNTAKVDRGETAISVFEPCLADGGSSARVGGVYPYSRGSWGEGVFDVCERDEADLMPLISSTD